MVFKARKRKSWSDASGVSEVVGNILILMITVVLFSTIIFYVQQMPVPSQTTKTSFAASAVFSAGYTRANLTVTNVGGEPLPAQDVAIIVELDGVNYLYNLSADPTWTAAKWTTGKPWTIELLGTTASSTIVVTVYDRGHDSIVWTSQVTGGIGGRPPSIMQRYADSNPATPTPDPVREGNNFKLFVTITDPDNDLNTTNGIWIDSSKIEPGNTTRPPDRIVGSVCEWFFYTSSMKATELDGKVIMIYAWDRAGHKAVSSFVVQVTILPVDTVITNNTMTEEVGEGGLPAYLSWISDKQGFGVYGENKTNSSMLGKADVSDARINFTKDERVFVRVASLIMNNVLGENKLTLIDQRTGVQYVPTYNVGPESTAATPFYAYSSGGNSFVYEAKFNTSGLPPSSYAMSISLASSGSPSYRFQTYQTLIIEQEGTTIGFYPGIHLYVDAALTTEWGTKSTPYSVTSTYSKIYVKIDVQDTSVPFVSPTVEEIRISDAYGEVQLYGQPPQGSMLGSWSASGDNKGYVFWIDVRVNNGNQWHGGTHAYTLFVSRLADSNEGVYSLSKQVFVTGGIGKSSFFVGTNAIYQAAGTNNFVNTENLFYIENNNFFTKSVLYTQYISPGTDVFHWMTAIGVGDIDGDNQKDMIVGRYWPSKGSLSAMGSILYYRNALNTYGTWQGPFLIDRPAGDATTSKITWVAIGDIDGDGDNDFVYGTDASKVIVFRNTYGATGVILDYTFSGSIYKVDLKDMTGDGMADLIVLSGGKVLVFDLTRWTPGVATTEIASIPNPKTTTSTIVDFDIADMNQDGMLDILTADTAAGSHSSIKGIWVNNYTANPTPTIRKLDEVASGYTPDQNAGKYETGPGTVNPVVATQSGDGTYLRVWENSTSEPSPWNHVDFVFKVKSTSTDRDQTLFINASIDGFSDEDFYVYFSTDAIYYTMVIDIPSYANSWTNYSFRLPPTVAGKSIYIRITDALSTNDSVISALKIDYVGVHSSLYGAYMRSTASDPAQRYAVLTSTTYGAVRAANINGFDSEAVGQKHLEVVVARATEWKAYNFKVAIGGQWTVSDANMAIIGPGTTSSPTVFCVADVNGDSLSDVITVATSVGSASQLSVIKLYLNLYAPGDYSVWYLQVKDLYAGMVTSQEEGSIVKLVVESPFEEA
jgi:hypothetical protein